MKKFFVAAAASLLLFGGQANASTVDDLNLPAVESQEVGHWADFRDEVILGRESDRERRERKKWERYDRERREWERRQRHREMPPPPVYVPPAPRPGYGAPPPASRPGYGAPPPAPRPGYGAPPPVPGRPGLPPPPPIRRR